MPEKDPSKIFHDKIKNLLKKAGFTIEKSDYYAAGPDIIANAEKQRIIVQCRCAETQGKLYPGLEHLIDEYCTKVKKEKAKVAILALSNYIIPEKHQDAKEKKRMLTDDKVVIWDDTAISYYERSVNALGTYAKYPLFGDLDIKEKFGRPEVVPAIEIKQSGRSFVLFSISPEKLLKISYVFRRQYSPGGYQRMLNPGRLKREIAKEFLDNPEALAILPNVIICAFESSAEFDQSSNKLTIPMEYASAWIIDGQHRLYAFCHVKDAKKRKGFTLPCVGFNVQGIPKSTLKDEEPGRIFVDINLKAKLIKPLLLLDLYEQIGVKDRNVEIVKKLAKTRMFKDRIQFQEMQKRHIALPTFAQTAAMDRLVRNGGIISEWYRKQGVRKDVPQEYCFKILKKYFSLVSSTFVKEWARPKIYILATNIGIRGLLGILEHILQYSNGLKDSEKAKACLAALKGSRFDFRRSALKAAYYGEGGAKKLAEDWIALIQDKIHDFGPQPKVVATKIIMPSNKPEGDSLINDWLSKSQGEVVGELTFIDKTTFEYLESIPSSCGIKLIVQHIKDPERCYKEAEKLATGRLYLYIKKIIDTQQLEHSFLHERWVADTKHKIDLGHDLKKDAVGKKKHTVTITDRPRLSDSYRRFHEIWEGDPEKIKKLFGPNAEKQPVFSYPYLED